MLSMKLKLGFCALPPYAAAYLCWARLVGSAARAVGSHPELALHPVLCVWMSHLRI